MLKPSLAALALLISSLPAAAQERQWIIDSSDQDAFLVFGVPESDDVGISIWCSQQSGKSKIFLPNASEHLKLNHKGNMTLTAGKVTVKLSGQVSDNQMDGTRSLEVELATDHPLYAAMQKADRLRVKVLDNVQVFPLAEADIAGLLKLCRKP